MSLTPFNPSDLETLGNVWVVFTESGAFDDYNKEILDVCFSEKVAKGVVSKLQQKIVDVKSEYFEKYGSTFDEDLTTLTQGLSVERNEDLYDTLSERISLFESQNESLLINNIEIQKRPLRLKI